MVQVEVGVKVWRLEMVGVSCRVPLVYCLYGSGLEKEGRRVGGSGEGRVEEVAWARPRTVGWTEETAEGTAEGEGIAGIAEGLGLGLVEGEGDGEEGGEEGALPGETPPEGAGVGWALSSSLLMRWWEMARGKASSSALV